MFGNLGMGEIIIIAGIALIVLGPEKFPEYAKIAMRAWRDLRGYVDDIKREMAEELKPVKKEIQQLSQYDPEQYIDKLTEAVTSVNNEVSSAVNTAVDSVNEGLKAEPTTASTTAAPVAQTSAEPMAQTASEPATKTSSGPVAAAAVTPAESVAAAPVAAPVEPAPARVDS